MSKVLAALAILIGGLGAVFSLLAAFNVHLTPDQHEAIGAVASLGLTVLGVWFHPATPFGQPKKPQAPPPG